MLKFKEWLQENAFPGWETTDSDIEPAITHQALPPLSNGPPPVTKGMIRLYRGTKIGELPHKNAFFSDERGLEGLAKAFTKIPGRHLVYVDVPEEIAKRGLVTVGVTDGEYKIPEEYRKQIRIY